MIFSHTQLKSGSTAIVLVPLRSTRILDTLPRALPLLVFAVRSLLHQITVIVLYGIHYDRTLFAEAPSMLGDGVRRHNHQAKANYTQVAQDKLGNNAKKEHVCRCVSTGAKRS